jgi:hypothetical protein
MKWYEIHDNFVLLCRYLVTTREFDAGALLCVISEPWSWEQEFHEARRWAANRDVASVT